MSKRPRLPPAVAAHLEELQATIRKLGVEIGTVLAAQQQEAKQPKPQPQRERLTEPPVKETIIETASRTRGYRAKATAQRLGIHQQTLWRWVRERRFPRGIKTGPMTTIWTDAMIAAWLQERAEESAGGSGATVSKC